MTDKQNAAGRHDARIAYGAQCSWWDSIDKVGSSGMGPLGSLPCCPKCGRVLFEMANEQEWFDGVDKYAADHPGYRQFIEWLRGKCFRTYEEAEAAYARIRHD